MSIHVLGRGAFVRVLVLRGCWIAGRRARRGEQRLMQRDEAAMSLLDGVVAILPAPAGQIDAGAAIGLSDVCR